MAHSYVTWLIYMWHDSFIYNMPHSFVTWLMHMWHDSFICDMTHSYVAWLIHIWRDSFICEMAHSYVTWLIHMWHLTLPEKTIDTARQSRSTMNGTIAQLHKGGSTDKTSDQRPVVLLNSGYQLLNYIINERLRRIVEQTNVLEPGQGGGRQGRSVNIHMPKMHFVAHEAHRQGNRDYRGHRLQKCLQCNATGSFLARNEHVSYTRRWLNGVDLRQCNSPSGSKRRRKCSNHVWYRCRARKHHIPATVQHLYQCFVADTHGNWAESGDQSWFADWQGQDADHGYQFNNIGFIDDISILAETLEGMQTLPDVVQEFTTRCGMEINVTKDSCV